MDAVALASVISSGAVGVATVAASFFNARAERKTRVTRAKLLGGTNAKRPTVDDSSSARPKRMLTS